MPEPSGGGGLRKGFLEEVVHELIGMSKMKRERCARKRRSCGRIGDKSAVSVQGTERY